MRLLILVASLAYASCGVLNGDITGDLRPPTPARQETSGYATTAGLGASASTGTGVGVTGSEGATWVGIEQQQQQLQQYQQQEQQQQEVAVGSSAQDNHGLLASYQPSVQQVAQVPQYQNSVLGGQGAEYQSSSLTTGAIYQQTGQTSGTGGNAHKYTTVTFGNGLVGLGHSVDYNAISQSQNQNSQNYFSSQGGSQNTNSVEAAIPSADYGAPTGNAGPSQIYDTISVSQNIQTVPIEVSQSYQVPTPVEVHRPVPVEVPQPVPVHVERPYPITVERPVAVHVPQPAYVKVPHAAPIAFQKPYPLVIEKPVSVKVPHKVELPEYHHGYHHNHNFDLHNFEHQYKEPPRFEHHQHHQHHQHQELPHSTFNEHSFHKDHFKQLNPHHSQQQHHYHHNEYHDVPHYHGSNHHSASILTGLTGGLSSKLRGGHGGGVSHHHGGGHGAAPSFGGDHKLSNGLGASYHTDASAYKFGHGFSGSLGFSSNSHLGGSSGGYASGYAGKYVSSPGSSSTDYAKHFPSFSYEKYPSTFSTGKYSGFSGYHGGTSSSNYKIPETINQQYDINGGYKY